MDQVTRDCKLNNFDWEILKKNRIDGCNIHLFSADDFKSIGFEIGIAKMITAVV